MSINILNRLRELAPEIANLKIKNITLSKSGRATFDFICDKAVYAETRDLLINEIREQIPSFFSDLAVNVTKIVADSELVAREIISYLSSGHMSVAHAFSTFGNHGQFPVSFGKNG